MSHLQLSQWLLKLLSGWGWLEEAQDLARATDAITVAVTASGRKLLAETIGATSTFRRNNEYLKTVQIQIVQGW